jgi:cyclopropane-fatty-acyl-phospholipid synthase
MIPLEEVSIDAPRDSDAWYLALMSHQFPGSFLPYGQEQVVDCATPRFRLLESSSGRLDHLETIARWRERLAEPSFRKTLMKARLVPRYLASSDFRLAFMDHYRLVFEKAGSGDA